MVWTMTRLCWIRSAGFPCHMAHELSDPASVRLLQGWLYSDEDRSTQRLRVGPLPAADEWDDIEEALLRNVREKLLGIIRDESFQEAVFLSNRESFERIRTLAADGWSGKRKRLQERTRLAWMYLQRFCTKNDTSSFYGPISWGEVVNASSRLEVERSSKNWLKQRKIFLEHWAIQALANVISDDPEIYPHLPIYLNPACKVEGETLCVPVDRRLPLRGDARLLLSRFHEGENRCGYTESELLDCAASVEGVATARAHSTLEALLTSKVLMRRIMIPTVDPNPEQFLSRRLSELPDGCARREHWLNVLFAVERLCMQLQESRLKERIKLTSDVQQLFESAIGPEALRRRSGEAYTGRYVFYEETERGLRFYIGDRLRDELAPVLELLLEAYRWVSIRAAESLNKQYLEIYEALVNPGERSVNFLRFYAAAARLDCASLITEVKDAIRRVWSAAGAPAESEEWRVTRAALSDVVSALKIDARDAAVSLCLTRVHSPDILLAARSLSELNRGHYQAVIGEVHPGVNTVAQPVALPFCPNPAYLCEEVNEFLSPYALVLADSSQSFQRSHINWPDCENLLEVVFGGGASRLPDDRQIPIGHGEVIVEDGWLYFRDARTQRHCDLLLTMPSTLHKILFEVAPLVLGADAHCRITCEKVILKRRSQLVRQADLFDRGEPTDRVQAFSRVIRWAASKRLPRYSFFKASGEPKPVFIDFLNPLAVDFFVRSLVRAEEVLVSEMRPGPDELWLEDSRGRFTCELRTTWTWQEKKEPRMTDSR